MVSIVKENVNNNTLIMRGMLNNKKACFFTIIGILVLGITTIYYKTLVSDNIIYHTSVAIFKIYGWAVISLCSCLIIWIYIKDRTISRIWPFIIVLVLNVFVFIYFKKILEPTPYQFRFSFINNTDYYLTDLYIVGDKKLKLNNLEKGKTLDIVFIDYSENTRIDLIGKTNNGKFDTLNLAGGITNSCGYNYEIEIITKNGRLIKAN